MAEREAANLGLAIAAHYANGGQVAAVTLTLRHSKGDVLAALLSALGKAWRSSTNNKRPRRLWRELTDGCVRKLEVTHGLNGWHPHLHLLVFLRPGVGAVELLELADATFAAWAARLVRLGLGQPTRDRGVRAELLTLEAAAERAASYVAKDAGRELASAGTKRARRRGSRTTYELLVDAAAGDGIAQLRFAEYEDAMHGRHRIEWSTGLKDRLLDPELVADVDDDQGRELAVLPDALHEELVAERGGPGYGELLDVAELVDDDAEAFELIWWWCRSHELTAPSPPDRIREAWEGIRRRPPPPAPPVPAQGRLL